MFLAAAIQMTTLDDPSANVAKALFLVDQAVLRGAVFVALPENVVYMGPERDKGRFAEPLDGPTLTRFAQKAREQHIHLLAGSILESGAPGGRFYNTSVLFGPGGERLAVYRKIHLFDVDIPDGARYRESETIAPGTEAVVVETPLAKIGLSVCYDLRFPELYRQLSARGAQVLCVPAAFTLHTGKDHWEVLLRARAIENTSYVVAPAQFGRHSEKRVTYGNALIADPWGTVIARAGDGEGMAIGPIDRSGSERVRREIPSLLHRRL
ncbi:MAG: carbon-nitrogen hydrolase family protein [Deltaproteobacteria bacterium]|nr:carbon-nitrogen hydrolase family protein [Deltaproteobacteria bacterium]